MTSARLGADPFPLTADPRAYVPRAASESALRALERALTEGRCGILAGPTGAGKTTLLHVLDARLGRGVRSVYVPNGRLDLDDVCRWALGMLGEPAGDNPREALLAVAQRLGDDGQLLLLLLDDASEPVFGAARSLIALSEKAGGALRLVLVPAKAGYDPRLAEALGAAAARIDFSAPMSAAETADLVRRRLASIGLPKEVRARFDAATIERIHRAASGNPRLVGLVASEILWPDSPGQGVEGAVAPQPVAPPRTGSRVGPIQATPVMPPEASPILAPTDAEPVALPLGEETTPVPAEVEPVALSREDPSAAPTDTEPVALPLGEETPPVPAEVEPVALPGDASSAGPSQAKPAATEKRPRLEVAVPAPPHRPSRRLGALVRPAALGSLGLVLLLAGIATLLLLGPSKEPSSPHSVLVSDSDPALVGESGTAARQKHEGAAEAEGGAPTAVPLTPGAIAPGAIAQVAPALEFVSAPPPDSVTPEPRTSIAEQQPVLVVPAPVEEALPLRGQAHPGGGAAPPSADTAVSESAQPPRAADPRAPSSPPDSLPRPARPEPSDRVPVQAIAKVEMPRPETAMPTGVAPLAEAPALPVTEVAKVAIYVNATPWAHIEMDGKALGATPLGDVPVAPGEHHFRALLPDGHQIERTVLISQEERHVIFSADPGIERAPATPPDPAVSGAHTAIASDTAAAADRPALAPPAPSEEAPDLRGQARSGDGASASGETPSPAVAPTLASAPAAKTLAPPATETPKVLIFINAMPWAHVEMDGEKLGVTPLGNVPASPGQHHFRALLPDGRQIERTVLVSQEARHFGFSLEPDPGGG